MENFNSIFELLAAFNFAYVLSSSFQSSLVEKLFSNYLLALETFESIQQQFSTLRENLENLQAKSKIQKVVALTKDLSAKITDFDTRVESAKDQISTSIDRYRSGNSVTFNFLCLYSALYCFFILLFAGCGWLSSDNSWERLFFLTFNTVYLLFAFLLWFGPSFKFYSNYYLVIGYFTLSLIITGTINTFFICESSGLQYSWVHTCNFFIALLSGSVNFIHAFFFASFRNAREGKNEYINAKKMEDEFKDLSSEVSTSIKTVEYIKR
jgi:hypothetical protein